MSDRSKMQLNIIALYKKYRTIDFGEIKAKQNLNSREIFSSLLLLFAIIGLPHSALAGERDPSNATVKQRVNNYHNWIEHSTTSIWIYERRNRSFPQQQQDRIEQQRQNSEQLAEQQRDWAKQQRQNSEIFVQQQQEWVEKQRKDWEQWTQQE